MKIVAKRTIVAVVEKAQVTVLPGHSVDLPEKEASALIAKGAALPLVEAPPPEEQPAQ